MLRKSPNELAQTGFFDIAHQLNPNHPLLTLGQAIDWSLLDKEFKSLYRILFRQAHDPTDFFRLKDNLPTRPPIKAGP